MRRRIALYLIIGFTLTGCLKVEYSPLDSSSSSVEGFIATITPSFIEEALTEPVTLTASAVSPSYPTDFPITDITFSWNGSPITDCSVTAGTLPAGLSINPADCTISGTPATGTVSAAYTITATSSVESVSTNITFATTPQINFTTALQTSAAETGTMTITAELSRTSNGDVSLPFAVNGSSSANGSDYTISASSVTIPAGFTTGTITITITGDTVYEGNETVIVVMGTPTNAISGATSTHIATITEDDPPPVVNFTAASQASASESGAMTITAQLSNTTALDVTVPFSINGSSTASGSDYTITASPITIPAGSTTATATISITGDALDENNETIIVDMGAITNAVAGATTTHTATITDDDNPPTVSFTTASQASTGETGTITITAQLSALSGFDVTVPFSVNGASTATGSDYSISTSPITINAGSLSGTATITITDDNLDENNETVIVDMTIGSLLNATSGTTTIHTATITDDDNPPTASFTTASQASVGETGTMTITAQLSALSGLNVTVPFGINGSSTASGSDYSISASPITINAGSLTGTATITITNDTLDEDNETVVVDMTTASLVNATAGTIIIHSASITDDDALPSISINNPSVLEGNSGTSTLAFTVSLTPVSGRDVTVNYQTADGTATTANNDYTAIGSTLLTFTAGQTSKTVNVTVIGDTVSEFDETFSVNLSGAVNANIATATGTGSIQNDDFKISSAQTMDCNSNGYIDHYKITFSSSVLDSTFPGYILNSLGNITTAWLVSGYSGIRLHHGTSVNGACGVTDTANDNVLYIAFNELGVYDTGAKPDLTTTATPGLNDGTSSLLQVFTASVTEADTAKPVLTSASGSGSTTELTATFSENVYGNPGAPACGSGGELTTASFSYTNGSGNGVSSITSMGSDTCAVTDSAVFLTTNTAILFPDDAGDTLAITSILYDAAGNTGNTTAVSLTVYPDPFQFTVKTDNTSRIVSANNQFKLPLVSTGTYNFTVKWGDGTSNIITVWDQAQTLHTYPAVGTYTITIIGQINGFGFNSTFGAGDNSKLIDVNRWGQVILHNNGAQFFGCNNLPGFSAPDAPDLATVTNFSNIFQISTAFSSGVSTWDVSTVTNMTFAFSNATLFNENISSWNTSAVTNMSFMFNNATAFNQPIGTWNTSSVTNMDSMFSGASSFNQPLNTWNVSSVTVITGMFSGATSFNQPLGSWDMSNKTDLRNMFASASSFNQDLSTWNTSSFTNIGSMFANASAFNGAIGNWNTSNITSMISTFQNTTSFNQDISAWNTSAVTNMFNLFGGASIFNQPIGSWNTAAVKDMYNMFFGAAAFNKDISTWNTSGVTDMGSMFQNASSFNQNISTWCVSNFISKPNLFDSGAGFAGNAAIQPQWGTCP